MNNWKKTINKEAEAKDIKGKVRLEAQNEANLLDFIQLQFQSLCAKSHPQWPPDKDQP